VKSAAPLAMWLLVTLFLAATSALLFYVQLNAFAVTSGVLTVFAALMTYDELHIYRRNRKREPRVEPPTRIPGYPEQPKRDLR